MFVIIVQIDDGSSVAVETPSKEALVQGGFITEDQEVSYAACLQFFHLIGFCTIKGQPASHITWHSIRYIKFNAPANNLKEMRKK